MCPTVIRQHTQTLGGLSQGPFYAVVLAAQPSPWTQQMVIGISFSFGSSDHDQRACLVVAPVFNLSTDVYLYITVHDISISSCPEASTFTGSAAECPQAILISHVEFVSLKGNVQRLLTRMQGLRIETRYSDDIWDGSKHRRRQVGIYLTLEPLRQGSNTI